MIEILTAVVFVKICVMGPSEACTQSKISQFEMTFSIDQDVVWFDVTMNETHGVNTFNGTSQLSNVKPELNQMEIGTYNLST